jgi:hypothetical protein
MLSGMFLVLGRLQCVAILFILYVINVTGNELSLAVVIEMLFHEIWTQGGRDVTT